MGDSLFSQDLAKIAKNKLHFSENLSYLNSLMKISFVLFSRELGLF